MWPVHLLQQAILQSSKTRDNKAQWPLKYVIGQATGPAIVIVLPFLTSLLAMSVTMSP